MRDKTITVTLGEDLYVKAPHVFQYDYGLMLVLDGVQLPADYEVHFSNKKHGVAKKAEVTENGVKIPDEYLRSGEDIYAWVYLRNGDEDGYTVYSIQFPVISRSVEQGDNITPVEHNIIDEAIEALNEAVEQTEQNVLNYPYINEDKYWMVYDAERGEFVNTGVKAQGDNRFNLDIGTVTTLPPGDEATASITWVGDDARLNLGLPAGDTSTLVSVHDERANDVTVTIHDGADNLGVDEFIIAIEPIQEGSGVPGPRNIRRISGVTGVTLTHTAGSYTETYETSFESEAGTVYSGVFNPMTGKLIIDRVLITKRCLDMDNAEVQPGWRNSGIRDIVGTGINQVFENQTLNVGTSYAVDTTGDNDLLYLDYNHYNMRQSDWKNTEITVQICVMLAEPMEYIFESYIPTVQLGDNTFTVNGGKIGYIKYPCDTKKYIEGAIDNSGYYTKPATGIPLADLSSGVTNEISNKIDKSQRGVSGGVAELDQNGKVPSTQLPSYVDDVLEYGSVQSFPLYGETGKIYVAKNTNKTYRWGGNGYVEISESLALGETSGSAFRGDHGKIAYDHAIDPNKTTAQAEGLYKVAVTGEGHVASVTNVEKSDIIALGIKEPEDLIDDTAGAGDTHKVWSANKLSSEIGAKYTKPVTGIPGTDIADGVIPDPTDIIDDTAGAGDTDKVWSADKVAGECSELSSAINQKQDAPETAGTAGQVLGLDSNLDPVWQTPASVPVQDVRIDGNSILNNGVADIPFAGSTDLGVVRTSSSNGIDIVTSEGSSKGRLFITDASSTQIKSGDNRYRPITSRVQHESTFYGLAKAAGADMASSSNPVGTYTEDAKIAIQKMLGIYESPWELIREDTFTNTTEADHIITVDGNGNAIELTDVALLFETPQQETDSAKGQYGDVQFYDGDNLIVTTQSNAWTQAANASAHGIHIVIEQKDHLLYGLASTNITPTNASTMRARYGAGLKNYMQSIKYIESAVKFTKINIVRVTGTGHYVLIGRRKWN